MRTFTKAAKELKDHSIETGREIRDHFSSTLKIGVSLIALTGVCAVGKAYTDYHDEPLPSKNTESGRTRNAVGVMVAGIVADKLYENANINITLERTLFPSSNITGSVTPDSIKTDMEFFLTGSHFSASRRANNLFSGKVAKSEIDWMVDQKDDSTWHVNRFGPKFDTELHLTVSNGKITGVYSKPLSLADYNIHGTYDDLGNVDIAVDVPLEMGIKLKGRITPR